MSLLLSQTCAPGVTCVGLACPWLKSQGACLIENGPSRLEVERGGVVLASDAGCSMSARLSAYATNLVFTASVVAMRSLLGKYLYRNCQLTRIVALHAVIDSEV
jgi:hypothetical protein